MNLENKKQLATIIFAAGLGLVTAFLTGQYIQTTIQQQTKQLAAEYQQQSQVVVDEVNTMKQAVGEMMRRQEDLDNQQKQLTEQQAQQIQAALAQAQGQGGPGAEVGRPAPVFSLRTPTGKRAVTVMIDSLSAVGGLVNPGDNVDIIAELSIPKGYAPDSDKDPVTTVLFQDLLVLAVGVNFEPVQTVEEYDNQQKSRSLNVTLAVDPEQAGLLTFAQQNGKLQLTLRGPEERGVENMDVASWETLSDYLLDSQSTEIAVPKKKSAIATTASSSDDEKPVVQVFRGGREL